MKSTAWMSLQRTAVGAAFVWAASAPAFAAEVALEGVSKDSLNAELRGGSLLIEQTLLEENKPSPSEIVAAAQADYKRLLAVLYDNGFYAAVINISVDGREASTIPPVEPPSSITRVVVKIDPGPKFLFGRVGIAPVADGTQLPEDFEGGRTARLGALTEAVSAGVTGWRAQGHAKAALSKQELTANHDQQRLDANLELAPGPRLRFGPLVVEGESDVRRERIIEIAGLPEGEVFSPEEIRLASERLRRTGAFNAVSLSEGEVVDGDDTLPIKAEIIDAPKRRIGFGAEYSTDEGFTTSAFWMHRNLLGGAERLRFDAEITGIAGDSGGIDYSLGVRFDRPATFNEDTNLFVEATIEQLDQEFFFSRNIEVEAGLDWLRNENQTYSAGVGFITAETRDAFGDNDYTLLTLPLGAVLDYRDNKLDATKGYYLSAEVMPFVAVAGADHGVRSYFDLRGYHTFGEARPVTLAFRGLAGSVFGPDLDVAPADYLFFSGGGGTVRGQEYQSLGVDVGDDTSGGRSFVGVSGEVRVSVTDTIGVVAFADAGYVGPEEFFDGSGEWQSGAGLGLRYKTGIGPIRFDVAVPTSGSESDENFQVYIGIGQSF
ncbi:autotransporter assembly complex family protein [Sulfitobacter sp.]|uniref:autotransporter assembly complex protein TamA n=1 Tax=Sulfitobacter sp. TaxID=1903071 RepID=UPI003298A8EB